MNTSGDCPHKPLRCLSAPDCYTMDAMGVQDRWLYIHSMKNITSKEESL